MKTLYFWIGTVLTGAFLLSCERVDSTIPGPELPEETIPEEAASSSDGDVVSAPIILSTSELKVAGQGNAFGLQVFRHLQSRLPGTDMLFSPLSLSLDLTLCAGGGVGQTQSQILETLGYSGKESDEVAGYYQKMVGGLSAVDPTIRIASANSAWVDLRFELKDSFGQYATDYFGADITTLDLQKKESLTQINGWCSDKTEGLISKVLDDSKDSENDIASYLINAFYFKGSWSPGFEFDEDMPEGTFHSVGGDRVATFLKGEHNYGYHETAEAQFASLEYGVGLFRLVLALPKEGVSMDDMITSLTEKDFFSLSHMDPVSLCVPKFSVDYCTEDALIPILKDMGMVLPFDRKQADFSGMFSKGPSFFIGQLFQKGAISVDETGTEAAASTVIMIEETAGPEQYVPVHRTFIADRPFIFALVEVSSRTILFLGQKVS